MCKDKNCSIIFTATHLKILGTVTKYKSSFMILQDYFMNTSQFLCAFISCGFTHWYID